MVLLGYMTWAAFQGSHYYTAPYLSPLYEPLLFIDATAVGSASIDHAWIGGWPAWWPAFLPVSPALLILAFPGAFRVTCYYYRKAYYRSFSATPPACAVGARTPPPRPTQAPQLRCSGPCDGGSRRSP